MKQASKKNSYLNKTIINLAVTLAMTAGLYAGSVSGTSAHAAATDRPDGDKAIVANEASGHDTENGNYLYQGAGVGAATGVAIGGPAGLVVGGLIGAMIGLNQDTDSRTRENITLAEDDSANWQVSRWQKSDWLVVNSNDAENPVEKEPLPTAQPSGLALGSVGKKDHNMDRTPQGLEEQGIQLARLGAPAGMIDSSLDDTGSRLLDILTADFSMDVYFRSGSATIESFYPARLAAIAQLVNSMPDLEVHLDGYSDRRGDRLKNRELAGRRIEEVRRQLIHSGVDDSRIVTTAFGEMKMVSAPGDLEGYTFDRKVVIRFQRISAESIQAMKQALSTADTDGNNRIADNAATENKRDSVSPVAADAIAQF